MTDSLGLLLGARYLLDERLGEGSSATVYRGIDTRLDRVVAVKLFHQQGAGPAMAVRQQAEMLFLARLNHPNLVSIYDAHVPASEAAVCPVSNEPAFLVMEFVDAVNLAHRLACGAMTLEDTAEAGRAVASALAAVHGEGLIHRDVKPANILLPKSGGAKLTDFGIARLLDSAHLTSTAEVLGTPLYLSPEQARGGEVGSATDIYSLGLVLLECLTGNAEFPGTPVQSAIARLFRDPQVPICLPTPWLDLLRSMTSPVPAERPTAETVASELAAHLEDRERSRTAVTVSASAADYERDLRHAPSSAAVVRAPSGPPRHTARPRLWGLAMLFGGLTLAVTGVSIAITGAQFDNYPTDPASTPTVVPTITRTAPTAARIAVSPSSSAVNTAQIDGNLAVNANNIAVVTETVTLVSTLVLTPTPLSDAPAPATPVSETDAATTTSALPSPTIQTAPTISPAATTPSIAPDPSGTQSTGTPLTEPEPSGTGTTTMSSVTVIQAVVGQTHFVESPLRAATSLIGGRSIY